MDRPAESVTSAAAELQTARQWSVSIILAGILLLIFVADRIMTPRMEQQEPPLLKPTVPWIGHIVGLIQKSAGYFMILRYECDFANI
jgi:hypothetical protein